MSSTSPQTLDAARAILGDDVIGPQEVAAALGGLPAAAAQTVLPFSRDELVAAREHGEMLVLRVAQLADGTPLTLLRLVHRFPDAFEKRLLRQVGYQLKDDWGIELEPLADTETCTAGWALVRKGILDATRNRAYDEQSALLRQYAETLRVSAETMRRRTAVETVYDTLLYFAARGVRLLENTWDWSSSRTVDGGYLNAGGFRTSGMQVLSYSSAVRHGALGVCPTRSHSG